MFVDRKRVLAHATGVRGGRTYARAHGRAGRVSIALRASRRLRPGRYLLTVVVERRNGRRVVMRRYVEVR